MKWIAIGGFVLSVLYIHFRGKVRLPPMRQLVNHSTFMAPVNALMLMLSRAPRTPFIPLARLPELAPLEENWQEIRAEAEKLQALRTSGRLQDHGDANVSAFLKHGWKQFYLKWYDAVHPSAQRLCPRTFALLLSIPSVKVATFVELPPGAKLSAHRDPFAGWLRYHLGLATPNSDRCFIDVDGHRHTWRDGVAMTFDETYLHWAINGSDTGRLVLLCDIERPMRFGWAQALNHLIGRTLMTATSPPNVPGRQRGLAGAMFRAMYHFGHCRRRLKARSMAAYRAALLVLVAGTAVLVYQI